MIDNFRGEYRFLSNFYEGEPIHYNMSLWQTAEHIYQAEKCYYYDDKKMIYAAGTPGKAKRLSKKVKMVVDWDEQKISVMKNVLKYKFSPEREEAKLLLDTDNEFLVEGNTWGDEFWGVCNGKGLNWLGHLLMQQREWLKEKQQGINRFTKNV